MSHPAGMGGFPDRKTRHPRKIVRFRSGNEEFHVGMGVFRSGNLDFPRESDKSGAEMSIFRGKSCFPVRKLGHPRGMTRFPVRKIGYPRANCRHNRLFTNNLRILCSFSPLSAVEPGQGSKALLSVSGLIQVGPEFRSVNISRKGQNQSLCAKGKLYPHSQRSGGSLASPSILRRTCVTLGTGIILRHRPVVLGQYFFERSDRLRPFTACGQSSFRRDKR